MATVKFRIRNKDTEEASINIYVSIGRGNMLQRTTGFSISPKAWKCNKALVGMPKQNNESNKRIFANLKRLEAYIHKELNESSASGELIDKYWLKERIGRCFSRKEKSDLGIITNYLEELIQSADTRQLRNGQIGVKENTIKGYKTFLKLLIAFENHTQSTINFLDINKSFENTFKNWLLKTKKYSVGYAGKNLSNLKMLCNDATINGIDVNPYATNIKSFKEKKEDRHIQYLSFEELEIIKNAELKLALDNARKWLLLGCEIGQRGKDLLSLTRKNIRHENGRVYIDLTQPKTRKHVTIGVVASDIIDIIDNQFPYKISLQNFNDYLKNLCEIAGINKVVKGKKYDPNQKRKVIGEYPKYKLISSHICRRSFATNYYKKMPTPILMQITGHSKESLFLEYIGKPQDKDENANLFIKFYEQIQQEKGAPHLKIVG
jgi:integrase